MQIIINGLIELLEKTIAFVRSCSATQEPLRRLLRPSQTITTFYDYYVFSRAASQSNNFSHSFRATFRRCSVTLLY